MVNTQWQRIPENYFLAKSERWYCKCSKRIEDYNIRTRYGMVGRIQWSILQIFTKRFKVPWAIRVIRNVIQSTLMKQRSTDFYYQSFTSRERSKRKGVYLKQPCALILMALCFHTYCHRLDPFHDTSPLSADSIIPTQIAMLCFSLTVDGQN